MALKHVPLSPPVKTKDVTGGGKAGTKAFCAADDGVVRTEPAGTITAPPPMRTA